MPFTQLGESFPNGLLVAMNSAARNFLIYNWRDLAAMVQKDGPANP